MEAGCDVCPKAVFCPKTEDAWPNIEAGCAVVGGAAACAACPNIEVPGFEV